MTFREHFIFLTGGLDSFFLIYFGMINLIYSTLLLLGTTKIYKRKKELAAEDFTQILRSNSLPEISFFVAAYNEKRNICAVVDNLLSLSYRYKQIIIINDGSTDETLELLKKNFQLIEIPKYYTDTIETQPIRAIYRSRAYLEILVIDKQNGHKQDALNAALNVCQSPYFITCDADTRIENAEFESLIRPILSEPKTIATGASVRILNGCVLNFNKISTDRFPDNYYTGMQALEYLRAFLMRQGWDYLGGNYVLSGAFSIFATKVIVQAYGFGPTVANDLEIILRLHRLMHATCSPYQIVYLPDPVAWTEGPTSTKGLGLQRLGWQRGTLESVWFHKCMFFNPRYGRFGLFVYPFLVLGDTLEPLMEVLGYLYIGICLWLGIGNPLYIFFFLCLTLGFTFVFTLFCLLIEEMSFNKYPTLRSFWFLFFYTTVENFGYRQLTIIWRLRGFIDFFKKFSKIQKDTRLLNERIDCIIKKGKIRW